MNKQFQALIPIFKKVAGIILLVVGTLSLVLPFTPGLLFIFFGLELLGLRKILWENIKKWVSGKKDDL